MNHRPDPDALLAVVKDKDKRTKQGKLRIFFGMAAGVGKTYAMLSTAHQKMDEGFDVVIGTVDTHGRRETEQLLKGIPIIARKKIEHRGVFIEEMDLDTIIERKPQIVIVDELAHTNAPGSRHPKRWQDVIEILENGIDVFSAVNIQHIESRKDDVEIITNITIHETIPDSILERADHIEVIDIPPEDLLRRLKLGKVYVEDKAQQAIDNFFKADKLMALREILLRISADKVDRELTSFLIENNREEIWKTQEKILLAVGHGPNSEKLVRSTKQLASRLRCPWLAVYVDTGHYISEEDKKVVSNNLELAKELGAKVLTTSEVDLVRGIERICRQHNVSQIVIGRPGHNFVSNLFRGGNVIERLNRLDSNISIHIARQQVESVHPIRRIRNRISFKRLRAQYLLATLWVAFVAFINSYLLENIFNLPYRSIGVIFLLFVPIVGLILSIGPTIWASLLAILAWIYLFVDPILSIRGASSDDIALAISFFLVGALTGGLTSIVKRNQNLLRRQEERTNTLYGLSLDIIEAESREACLKKMVDSLSKFFNSKISITLRNPQGALDYFKKGEDWIFNKPKEWIVANWCFDKAKPAGRWTDTMPSATCMFVPLLAKEGAVGVLGFYDADPDTSLAVNDREMLFTICSQLGIYLQREFFHESALANERFKKSEKLHQTLLNSISHEIKTPLTAISGIAETLGSLDLKNHFKDQENYVQLQHSLMESSERLQQVVDNILDMSRLDSGVLNLKEEWFDIRDMIDNVQESLKYLLKDFEVIEIIPENFPLIFVDGRLIEQVITNLMLNSIKYAEDKKQITIELVEQAERWKLYFADCGPGIDPAYRGSIFNKFFRLPKAKSGGTGLGLSIVKSIVELHKGDIQIIDSIEGLAFNITFPKYSQPALPEEYQ